MCWAFSTLPGWLIAIFNSNVEDDERAEKKPVKIFMPNHRRLPKCSLLLSLDHRPAVCTRRIFRHRQMYKDERKKEIFVLYKFSLLYWLLLLLRMPPKTLSLTASPCSTHSISPFSRVFWLENVFRTQNWRSRPHGPNVIVSEKKLIHFDCCLLLASATLLIIQYSNHTSKEVTSSYIRTYLTYRLVRTCRAWNSIYADYVVQLWIHCVLIDDSWQFVRCQLKRSWTMIETRIMLDSNSSMFM